MHGVQSYPAERPVPPWSRQDQPPAGGGVLLPSHFRPHILSQGLHGLVFPQTHRCFGASLQRLRLWASTHTEHPTRCLAPATTAPLPPRAEHPPQPRASPSMAAARLYRRGACRVFHTSDRGLLGFPKPRPSLPDARPTASGSERHWAGGPWPRVSQAPTQKTDRLEAKQLRMCLLSQRVEVLRQK